MHLQHNHPLFEQLTEGVIFLNFKGEVLHSNKAAQQWLHACVSAKAGICTLILQEITGRTKLPVATNFVLGSNQEYTTGTSVWLHKYGLREYVLLIKSARASAPERELAIRADVVGHHYVMLMGEQIRQKIAGFHELSESSSLPEALRNISWQIDSLLHEVSSLALLTQRDQVFAQERIDFDVLLKNCLARLVAGDERATRHHMDLDNSLRGAVYGDSHWLSFAFEVLLLGLLRGMAPNSHLHISARQVGDFVMVTGRDEYGSEKRAAGEDAPNARVSNRTRFSNDPVQLATRMLMTQRILELHSGHLKLNYLPSLDTHGHEMAGPIEWFTVTLLTGVPLYERSRASCTKCNFNLQAQAYAEDIAQLLATTS